jgi:hypothetical protein
MWVTIDTKMQWLRTVHLHLPPNLWPYECIHERDVISQYDAAANCSLSRTLFAADALLKATTDQHVGNLRVWDGGSKCACFNG